MRGSHSLPVASSTWFPFITSGQLHMVPIHYQWPAIQGSHSLPVASYVGFPFIASGNLCEVPIHCRWLAM